MSDVSTSKIVEPSNDAATALSHLTAHRMPALSQPEYEAVDHPDHYGGNGNPYEAILVIEAWELGFNTGNTVKYLNRAGKKPGTAYVDDLKKAAWYLQREIERCSG